MFEEKIKTKVINLSHGYMSIYMEYMSYKNHFINKIIHFLIIYTFIDRLFKNGIAPGKLQWAQ